MKIKIIEKQIKLINESRNYITKIQIQHVSEITVLQWHA